MAAGGSDIDLLGDAQAELAEVLWRCGRRNDAGPPWREALELFERKENLVSADRVRARLAEVVSA
jgi:hypothetical protein